MDESYVPHPAAVEWYETSHLRRVTSSDFLGWSQVEMDISEHGPVADISYVPFDEQDVISFILEGTLQVQSRIDGVLRQFTAAPGTMFIIPRQTEFGSAWNSSWTNGAIRLNSGMVSDAAAALQRGDPAKFEIVPVFFFNDPLLYHLGLELAGELRSSDALGPLYAESLANSMILYLLRHYSTRRVVRQLTRSRLTPAQLRLIDEYIYAHIEQKITLADLARCVHLSVPHFERMFRTTTQHPAYRHVLEIRLNQAKLMLELTGLPLTDIALRCGFSSQSHLTTHFTRHFGISPARFARNVQAQRSQS